jgi:hypothetical protein
MKNNQTYKFYSISNKFNNEHSDEEIVDILFSDFPKVGEQILEYLDNQNK